MEESKLFKYRGKTLEELKSMELKDFAKLLPSRTRRKLERGFAPAEEILLSNIRSNQRNIGI